MIFAKKIEKIYRAKAFSRYDDTGRAFYFSHKDFDRLNAYPYSFKTKAGNRLQGYFYSYEAPAADRIIIFEHGMGGGHRAYMKEIELLARHGYLVFSYDHTGCMESEGSDTGGFATTLSDLDAALVALKADEVYGNMSFSVVGHSWGAFSTMNIPALHPDVTHIVAMSGFISVENLLRQTFSGIMRLYFKHIYKIEEKANPDYVKYSALDSLAKAKTKALIIHSSDDKTVRSKFHFDLLYEKLKEKENVSFLPLDGKNHNPNYTADAIAYMGKFFADMSEKTKAGKLETREEKKAFLSSYDWHRMTAQDETVWQKIFEHLEK